MRSQAVDEESPPTSLVSIYLRMHNTYLILVLLFVSDEEEAVKALTRWSSFTYDSLDVIYEQDVGSESSITVDTAFRKIYPCRGVPTIH